jgi:hypothetical protein
MIGDALGVLAAARSNNALFFPIPPDQEEAAWKRFHDDIYGRFLSGRYAGECETGCIAEFERLLPETPPWGETSSGA